MMIKRVCAYLLIGMLSMLSLSQVSSAENRSAPATESIQQKNLPSIKPLKWKVARKGKPGEFLTNINYGNGMFVVIGNNEKPDSHAAGLILTSSDGETWTERKPETPKDEYIVNVAYVSNQFVISGGRGSMLTSSDGINWSKQTAVVSTYLGKAKFVNGLFFIAADPNYLLTSVDLNQWTVQSFPGHAPERIIFGNGLYVMVSHKRQDQRQGRVKVNMPVGSIILSSTDGKTWMERATADKWITDMSFTDNRFIAVTAGAGLILHSNDGITWERSDGLPDMGALMHGNGIYIAASDQRDKNGKTISQNIISSIDGLNWQARKPLPLEVHIDYAIFDRGRFFVLGSVWDQKAPTMKLSKGYLWTSTDGINWQTQSFKFPGWAARMYYVNGMLVALGQDGTIMTALLEME